MEKAITSWSMGRVTTAVSMAAAAVSSVSLLLPVTIGMLLVLMRLERCCCLLVSVSVAVTAVEMLPGSVECGYAAVTEKMQGICKVEAEQSSMSGELGILPTEQIMTPTSAILLSIDVFRTSL